LAKFWFPGSFVCSSVATDAAPRPPTAADKSAGLPIAQPPPANRIEPEKLLAPKDESLNRVRNLLQVSVLRALRGAFRSLGGVAAESCC